MLKHLSGFCITLVASAILGPLGLILGVIAWWMIAKD